MIAPWVSVSYDSVIFLDAGLFPLKDLLIVQ